MMNDNEETTDESPRAETDATAKSDIVLPPPPPPPTPLEAAAAKFLVATARARKGRDTRGGFFDAAWNSTVKRGNLYGRCVREKIKRDARYEIQMIEPQYDRAVDSETHIANIVAVKEALSEEFKLCLPDGRVRFGSAQKLLNQYLKYLWCAGHISAPPHCPFDNLVINRRLPDKNDPYWDRYGGAEALEVERPNIWRWTKCDDPADYQIWLAAAAEMAARSGGENIAEWDIIESANDLPDLPPEEDPEEEEMVGGWPGRVDEPSFDISSPR